MITWRVVKCCRFVGYVKSPSMMGAQRLAQEKFGKDCWVERSVLSNPTDLARVAVVSQS